MSARWFPDGMPVPAVNDDTRPFFEAARQHRLVAQCCGRCGRWRHPPRPLCPYCRSFDVEWSEISGDGTVFSYCVVHQPFSPALRSVVPYTVAIVELDGTDGTRMASNLVDVPEDQVRVGLGVRVVWEDMSPDLTLPRFTGRPA